MRRLIVLALAVVGVVGFARRRGTRRRTRKSFEQGFGLSVRWKVNRTDYFDLATVSMMSMI